jgi:MFS family permease
MRAIYRQIIQLMSAIIPLVASVLSDSYGRIKIFNWFTVIILIFSLIAAFIPSITVKILAMGAFVGEEGVLCTLFSIIINESCASDSKLRSKAIGLYFSIYAFGGVVIGSVTYILDDSWWLYLLMVCLSALTFIPVPFLALEPVKQLYKRGKVSDLFRN